MTATALQNLSRLNPALFQELDREYIGWRTKIENLPANDPLDQYLTGTAFNRTEVAERVKAYLQIVLPRTTVTAAPAPAAQQPAPAPVPVVVVETPPAPAGRRETAPPAPTEIHVHQGGRDNQGHGERRQAPAPAPQQQSPAPAPQQQSPAPAPQQHATGADHWFTTMGSWARLGVIGLFVVLLVSLIADQFATQTTSAIANTILPPSTIRPYNGPFWSSVFTNVDWASLARWLLSILTAMLIYQLLVVLDVLNNFTGADFPGLAGQILVLVSPLILNPIWTLGTLWTGLLLIRRDRDSRQNPTVILAWAIGVTLMFDLLGRSYQRMPTGLTSTILKWIGSWLYSLTPETIWWAAFPSITLFLLSYIRAPKVDSDGMAGAMLFLATGIAVTNNVPYMAGTTIHGWQYTAVVIAIGLIAFFLAFRETSSKLSKPYVGFIISAIYWVALGGLSQLVHHGLLALWGWNIGLLGTTGLAAVILGLLVGVTQWGQQLSSDAEGKATYRIISTVWGDAIVVYVLFFPAAYQVFLVALWVYSMVTKQSLI